MARLQTAKHALGTSSRTHSLCSKTVSSAMQSSSLAQMLFVPEHMPAKDCDIARLQEFVDSATRIVAITGAGISTESGIPDYRSPGVGLYARSSSRPVQYSAFAGNGTVRQRYWARNYVGWSRFSSFEPNPSHLCLAQWEKAGKVHWVVTQNVDRLHHKAGTENVIELHGTTYRVKCMSCEHAFSRHKFQQDLVALNPTFNQESVVLRPDGDVDLDSALVKAFRVPQCQRCSGNMIPDIVFFGGTVPISRVKETYERVREADAILVVGSSLQVYSAYRFVLAALEERKPIAIVNIGPTRADRRCLLKVDANCGTVLPKIWVAASG